MTISTGISLVVVGVVFLATGASGCSCQRVTDLYNFCHADYVVAASVEQIYTPENEYENTEYEMNILYSFKVNSIAWPFFSGKHVVQTQSPPTSLCGFEFELDETYLISGDVRNGLFLGNCYWIQNINKPELTPAQYNILLNATPTYCESLLYSE